MDVMVRTTEAKFQRHRKETRHQIRYQIRQTDLIDWISCLGIISMDIVRPLRVTRMNRIKQQRWDRCIIRIFEKILLVSFDFSISENYRDISAQTSLQVIEFHVSIYDEDEFTFCTTSTLTIKMFVLKQISLRKKCWINLAVDNSIDELYVSHAWWKNNSEINYSQKRIHSKIFGYKASI